MFVYVLNMYTALVSGNHEGEFFCVCVLRMYLSMVSGYHEGECGCVCMC